MCVWGLGTALLEDGTLWMLVREGSKCSFLAVVTAEYKLKCQAGLS